MRNFLTYDDSRKKGDIKLAQRTVCLVFLYFYLLEFNSVSVTMYVNKILQQRD